MLSASGAPDGQSVSVKSEFNYPLASRADHVDDYHGTKVADPYRAFEDLQAPATKRFVEAQNALSQPFLEKIPERERIKARLTQLWNYERYDVPVKGARVIFI